MSARSDVTICIDLIHSRRNRIHVAHAELMNWIFIFCPHDHRDFDKYILSPTQCADGPIGIACASWTSVMIDPPTCSLPMLCLQQFRIDPCADSRRIHLVQHIFCTVFFFKSWHPIYRRGKLWFTIIIFSPNNKTIYIKNLFQ
jgi:hypothetical protein